MEHLQRIGSKRDLTAVWGWDELGIQVAYCRKFSWSTWATKAEKIEVEKSRLPD
jgi:hypothetical protein